MTRCTSCHESKPANAFGYQGSQKNKAHRYLRSECKACRAGKETLRNQSLTPEQRLNRRNRQLQRFYGIDLQQYNELFSAQKGLCPGCRKHQIDFTKALAVDHCHITSKIRGLLCPGCNLAIGNVKENPATLRRLADYLEENMNK